LAPDMPESQSRAQELGFRPRPYTINNVNW